MKAPFSSEHIRKKTCVILPTYNNAGTIQRVIEGILRYTDQLIIVNDGSTDDTGKILSALSSIHQVSYTRNRGKGYALRQGFREAARLGYEYAITIDSDGQHLPEDLEGFISKNAESPGKIIIGARNMDQNHIPGGSTFGHRFSNFWFRVETGISLPDTQSGYRLYPLQEVLKRRYFTNKYEFEIEVIVRLVWSGVGITSVPVRVYYAPKGERVSHFRPYKDFTRVSLLNSLLVTISLVYIRPRNLLFRLFRRKRG
jgi:glycosyltransferase involved in cell wall biosynthesis